MGRLTPIAPITVTNHGRIVRGPREHNCRPPERFLWHELDIQPGDKFVCNACNTVLTAVSHNGELEWTRDG